MIVTKDTLDYRGISYEAYVDMCRQKGRAPLSPQKAADNLSARRPAGKPDILDWEMAAVLSPPVNMKHALVVTMETLEKAIKIAGIDGRAEIMRKLERLKDQVEQIKNLY